VRHDVAVYGLRLQTSMKCSLEMALSKVFLVRSTVVIVLPVKNDSIDCVLSSCRMDLREVDKCRFGIVIYRSDDGQLSYSTKSRSVYEVLELRFVLRLL